VAPNLTLAASGQLIGSLSRIQIIFSFPRLAEPARPRMRWVIVPPPDNLERQANRRQQVSPYRRADRPEWDAARGFGLRHQSSVHNRESCQRGQAMRRFPRRHANNYRRQYYRCGPARSTSLRSLSTTKPRINRLFRVHLDPSKDAFGVGQPGLQMGTGLVQPLGQQPGQNPANPSQNPLQSPPQNPSAAISESPAAAAIVSYGD